MTPHQQIVDSINNLQSALVSQNPQLPVILRSILQKLKSDPEVVTLLSEDEFGTIVKAARVHSGVVITTTTSKASAKKALSKLSADDI